MSTSAPSNSISFRVPENITFSRDFSQFLLQFTDVYQKLAVSSNAKEIALYETGVELLNGQQFSGANPQTKIQIYRKCFQFGTIAPGATLTIAHGVTYIDLTDFYGTYQSAAKNGPLPRVSATLITDQVSIDIVGANIVVVNGATAPAITSGRIIMEYTKN